MPRLRTPYLILRDLQKDFAARLRVVFRHYPLSGIHHHAQEAAEAAEAAGAQGKFWEMHTLLFERDIRTSASSALPPLACNGCQNALRPLSRTRAPP
jgi:protein-disulfide isomerase